jgi:hypothetical protein
MNLTFKLIEQHVTKEDLVIHNQKARHTKSTIGLDHLYFEKRIKWDLLKADGIKFYTEKELIEIQNELSQPIHINVEHFESLGDQFFIKEVLNNKECFTFEYKPSINDALLLTEVYKFNSANNIQRPERMTNQMVFLYSSSGWELFEQEFKSIKIFKSGLIVK